MSVAMEKFFTPTRRYQDIWLSDRFDDTRTEVELAVPVEDFLSYQWSWEDLYAFVSSGDLHKIVWITKHAFLDVKENPNEDVFQFGNGRLGPRIGIAAKLQATSGQEHTLMLLQDSDPAHPTGACNIFWRAITTSNMVQLGIYDCRVKPGGLPFGPVLSQFLRESPSLQVLKFQGFDFKEEHCRALVTIQRTDFEVTLSGCILEPQDAKDTFIEWFRHNQVVTELACCDMDSSILRALSGNNSVKRISFEHIAERKIRSLAQALPGNMGIERLHLSHFEGSDEILSLLFRSLATHPRLESLSIPFQSSNYERPQILSAAFKTTRMQVVLEMLRHNTVIQTIDLPDHFRDVEVYLNAILPRLEMNRSCFEVQRQAMKRADPSIRPQLLGRALHVVQYNPELVFRFLSENVPAFVRTEEEKEDSAFSLQNDPVIASGQKRKAP